MNGNTASLQQDAKHSKNIYVTLNSSEKKRKGKDLWTENTQINFY